MRFRRHRDAGDGDERALVRRLRRAEMQISRLRRQVRALESEIQEARHLSKRLADITDVVSEVLLPATSRDEERIRSALAKYDSSL